MNASDEMKRDELVRDQATGQRVIHAPDGAIGPRPVVAAPDSSNRCSWTVNELRIDLERLREVCRRSGVVHLDVFGSVARGDADADSDIDLLYVISPQARLGLGIFDLETELAEIFGRKVDLVSKKYLHPMLRDHVIAEAQELYAA